MMNDELPVATDKIGLFKIEDIDDAIFKIDEAYHECFEKKVMRNLAELFERVEELERKIELCQKQQISSSGL